MIRESELAKIATYHKVDSIANRAMKILRSRYNSTYHWCLDWDQLVICDKDHEYKFCNCNK